MISDDELCRRAGERAARCQLSEHAFAGNVASALKTQAGQVFLGVSIVTDCSMGFCAEHNAIGSMVTAGESAIDTIVAVDWRGRLLPPCGRCREFIVQINPQNWDTRVLLPGGRVATTRELLPDHWAGC